MEIWKTAARADGKTIHNLMEKDKPFPTGMQTAFPQPHNPGSLHTFPQRLLLRVSILSLPIRHDKKEKKSGSTAHGQTEKAVLLPLLVHLSLWCNRVLLKKKQGIEIKNNNEQASKYQNK